MLEQLNSVLKTHWQNKGFESATAIQTLLYQPIQDGKSLVAISPTGSGKTLAYLLPILSTVQADQSLQVIILAPSQELVKQISTVVQEWGELLGIHCLPILGNANLKRQLEALKERPEVIVATPGRLQEIAQQSRKVKFHQVKTIVLDEGDYLLEDSQEEAVNAIVKRLMRDVQKVWVSATYGPALQRIVEEQGLALYQQSDENTMNIKHVAILTQNRQKGQQLKRLAQVEGMQAIVFFEQVSELETIAAKLIFENVSVGLLHGQLSKMERERSITAFRNGELTYLLTTDVAARGLDIADLPAVIHFNRVSDVRTYTHRSGRTGRMGKQGMVISLVNEQELRDLNEMLVSEMIALEPYTTYKGALMSELERNQLRDEEINKPVKVVKKATKKRPVVTTNEKVKKKNRRRDTKNKGKRRPKQ
ncbi:MULTISPECIES: DEAD/DEAH box helicase [unclassified Facklamia]|uniref:DEAD/DEAH box helicase n=1 Tax=Aerococcaceae TaxID=186827 RepID=UPI0013BBFB4A|nr:MULTISPECIES: DEAD/DEAH box helicase [unclassified Facklamia]NEW64212.1 DEAD/DEAH box helicase [Facklamia sp. 252]NEW68299.1 DEAD/DEAH box helicase [Facklamia sp. 253]QQD65918.1 DEAD/DEAH box helicase [Aerococcaceae bacterium zg-252]